MPATLCSVAPKMCAVISSELFRLALNAIHLHICMGLIGCNALHACMLTYLLEAIRIVVGEEIAENLV